TTVRNHDSFSGLNGVPCKKQFDGSIAAVLLLRDIGAGNAYMLCQSCTVCLGQIRHLLRVGDEFRVYPLARLIRAKLRPTPTHHHLILLARSEIENVDFGGHRFSPAHMMSVVRY